MSWWRREADGHTSSSSGGGQMESLKQRSGQTHIWEHFEDLGGDGKDPAGVHLVAQLGARRGVGLGGEQEGRSVAASGQRHPNRGTERRKETREASETASPGRARTCLIPT